MLYLAGNISERKWAPVVASHPWLGTLLSPITWRSPWCRYACDNDVFGHRDDPSWWDLQGETAWLRMLDRIPGDNPPLFVLLPDVVGDWPQTLGRAWRYLYEVRARGLVAAVALQDGGRFEEAAALGTEWVFVGGSTAWKEATIGPACGWFGPRGVRVHVGRVNTRTRLQACITAGATSCDGTGLSRYSREMWPRLARVMEQERWQPPLLDLCEEAG